MTDEDCVEIDKGRQAIEIGSAEEQIILAAADFERTTTATQFSPSTEDISQTRTQQGDMWTRCQNRTNSWQLLAHINPHQEFQQPHTNQR